MAIASVGTLIGKNDKVAGTSFTLTTESANLTVGTVGILVIAKDNAATADAETLEFTDVDDAAGNLWWKVREFCNSQAAANGGATVSVWMTTATTALGSGANITVTMSDSRTAKAITGWVFSVGAGKTLTLDAASTLANDAADAGNITLSGLANVEHLFLRAGAVEDSAATYTASTNYTTFEHTGANTTGGAGNTNMAARGEFRILTGTSDSTDPTTTSADQASIMLAFSEVDQGAQRFTAVDSQYAQPTYSGSSSVGALTAGSISGWFRSHNKGTTRLTMYNEGAPGATINMFVALNDGTNGQIRFFRRDASSNQVSLTYGTTLCDGQWHHFCVAWTTLSSHVLYVDGVSRATDSTTNLSGSLTMNSQTIGRREIPTGTASGYYDGELCDFALYGVGLSSSEQGELYAKTKHCMNVRSTWTDLRSYWPMNPGSVPNDEDMRDYRDLTRARATLANGSHNGSGGPDGKKPTGMIETTDISKAWIWMGIDGTAWITRGASAGDQDRLIREPGNCVHNPADSGKEYKVYYSGSDDPYNGGDVAILMAYASTLTGTWTKQGVVIANATLPMEDPWVYRDPATGTYHLWAENKTGGTNANGIAHFTSSDGITWSSENNTAIDNGAGGQWDEFDVSSPIVWKEGSTWYMLYEGRSGTGTDGSIGLATASSPNGPWTKSGSNPVITPTAPTAWDDQAIIPDHLVKIGSTYWLIYHGTPDGTVTRLGIASSTNLTTWTKAAHNPITTDLWGGHHIQGFCDDFDRFFIRHTEAAPELWRLQAYGDPAVQVAEWPDINPDKPDTMHVINFAPTRAAFY